MFAKRRSSIPAMMSMTLTRVYNVSFLSLIRMLIAKMVSKGPRLTSICTVEIGIFCSSSYMRYPTMTKWITARQNLTLLTNLIERNKFSTECELEMKACGIMSKLVDRYRMKRMDSAETEG